MTANRSRPYSRDHSIGQHGTAGSLVSRWPLLPVRLPVPPCTPGGTRRTTHTNTTHILELTSLTFDIVLRITWAIEVQGGMDALAQITVYPNGRPDHGPDRPRLQAAPPHLFLLLYRTGTNCKPCRNPSQDPAGSSRVSNRSRTCFELVLMSMTFPLSFSVLYLEPPVSRRPVNPRPWSSTAHFDQSASSRVLCLRSGARPTRSSGPRVAATPSVSNRAVMIRSAASQFCGSTLAYSGVRSDVVSRNRYGKERSVPTRALAKGGILLPGAASVLAVM
jgi:hypothetical protein